MPRIKLEGLNSIYDEPNISSTIKENPFAANVELEGGSKKGKGEVVLRPDGEALHDVVGKRHYAGGVETWLPEGSFVFSDFKDLAFNKRDHKLFELKEGGSYRKHDNTPAEVLRRNIDVKHYNKMSETLGNKYKDTISKNTAELMLSKYQEKLGQIALIQESKKGFPEGKPFFSEGTAPVYEDEFKEDIMEQKQYMKFGGNVLPKFEGGGRKPGVNGEYRNGKWVPYSGGDTDGTIGRSPTPTPIPGLLPIPKINIKTPPLGKYQPKIFLTKKPENPENPKDIEEGNPSPVEIPWTFTPWQKYSMGLGFKNYAGINRLMPMRSQINSPLVELERMVEPSYLGELASGFRANQVMNPYLAGVNNAQMYGQMLNADRQSIAQNINANNQIANQQNLMNNQIQRQDLQTNIGADQQYYNATQLSKQNFDNMRSTVREQNRSELMGNVQSNEALAMAMARMGKDRPFDYNFRTGQIYHTGRGNIMDASTSEGKNLLNLLVQSYTPDEIKRMSIADRNNLFRSLIGKDVFSRIGNLNQKMGGYNPYRR